MTTWREPQRRRTEKKWFLGCKGWSRIACLRLSDLEGLCPKRLLGTRGLRGVLIRTKTTGPGKLVKEMQIFVSRRISLSGHDWLQAGYELWDSYGHKDRDNFMMSTDQNMNKRKYASVERVAIYVRQVLMGRPT